MLGEFHLESILGNGGMGTVYEARWGDKRCAVKVLSPSLAADAQLRERFVREAKAMQDIRHPSLVEVWAFGEERGFLFYAMEKIEGVDLRARLKDKGTLSPQEVSALAESLLPALDAVHRQGLIHRDIKPSNILCPNDGAPRLCDFGIAFFPGAQTLTTSAAILGSLRYMSPEQQRGSRCDARSDLYSLGLVLHEALSGGLPGDTPLPRPLSARLRDLILRLTEFSPENRPVSAGVALALLQEEPPGRRLLPRAAAVGQPAGCRRRRAYAAAARPIAARASDPGSGIDE
jgi:serine/threonine-protein kinase